jgi:hypothetical protein
MEHHPYFNLWLHSTDELSEQLSISVVERTTLHEWPLSCVQRLRLADGSQLIYKSQLQDTTVEPAFYKAVQDHTACTSFLKSRLPRSHHLGCLRNSVGMTFEYIVAPRLEEFRMDETEIMDHGNRMLADIHQLPVDLPVYTDISTTSKWSNLVQDTLTTLSNLITYGQFQQSNPATIRKLTKWGESEKVLAALQSPPTLNHGDLGGDNVFATSSGYKIIDWQRPVRGPAEIDWVAYLAAMGIDPLKYIESGFVGLFWFLCLRWFVECKARWFTTGESYDQQVSALAEKYSNFNRNNYGNSLFPII